VHGLRLHGGTRLGARRRGAALQRHPEQPHPPLAPGWTAAEVYRAPSGWSNGLTLDGAAGCSPVSTAGDACRGAVRPARRHGDARRSVGRQAAQQPERSGRALLRGGLLHRPELRLRRHTVPLLGAPGQRQALPFQGVYRIDPDGTLHLLTADGFAQPNGLVFSPDEQVLYVNDSKERVIWRYQVNGDLSPGSRTLFVDQRGDARFGNPDGMKVDTEGRLWTTGAGGVSVHTAAGEGLGVFEMDEHAANITFGGHDLSTLYLTARTSVYRVCTAVTGIAPGSGARRH